MDKLTRKELELMVNHLSDLLMTVVEENKKLNKVMEENIQLRNDKEFFMSINIRQTTKIGEYKEKIASLYDTIMTLTTL